MKGLLTELNLILAEKSPEGVEGCPGLFFIVLHKIKNELEPNVYYSTIKMHELSIHQSPIALMLDHPHHSLIVLPEAA